MELEDNIDSEDEVEMYAFDEGPTDDEDGIEEAKAKRKKKVEALTLKRRRELF